MEARRVLTPLGPDLAYTFPPFALLRQVLSRVLLLTGLSLVLVVLLWPCKDWFPDLLSLFVVERLRFLQVWNLLVQPHVWRFQSRPRTLQLHAWKLSSVLSRRQAFLKRLRESQLRTSGTPLLPCASPSGPGSSIGAISGVVIPARRLSLG